jgi:hypothetical protein
MKLPVLSKIRKEDILDAPEWVARIINPINDFFERIYLGLNKEITFEDNIKSEIRNIKLKQTDLPYSFTTLKAQGILKLMCEKISGNHEIITNAVDIDWTIAENTVTINNITGIDSTSDYNLRLLII